MAVAFISAQEITGTSSIDVGGSGSNVVIFAFCRSTTNGSITAPTYNGVSLTLWGSITGGTSTGNFLLYYLVLPASGTNSFNVGTFDFTEIYSFSGASATGPIDLVSNNQASPSLFPGTITPTISNGFIICGLTNNSTGTINSTAGQGNILGGINTDYFVFGTLASLGAGNQVISTWTTAASGPHSTIMISIFPASGTTTSTTITTSSTTSSSTSSSTTTTSSSTTTTSSSSTSTHTLSSSISTSSTTSSTISTSSTLTSPRGTTDTKAKNFTTQTRAR